MTCCKWKKGKSLTVVEEDNEDDTKWPVHSKLDGIC